MMLDAHRNIFLPGRLDPPQGGPTSRGTWSWPSPDCRDGRVTGHRKVSGPSQTFRRPQALSVIGLRMRDKDMDIEKFTERATGFLQAAQTIAIREFHQRITAEHLLKALLDDEEGAAAGLIQAAGGDPKRRSPAVEAELARQPKVQGWRRRASRSSRPTWSACWMRRSRQAHEGRRRVRRAGPAAGGDRRQPTRRPAAR